MRCYFATHSTQNSNSASIPKGTSRAFVSLRGYLDQKFDFDGRHKLNRLYDSMVRDGYDQGQALEVVCTVAMEDNRVTNQGLHVFLAQQHIIDVLAAHRDEPFWQRFFSAGSD